MCGTPKVSGVIPGWIKICGVRDMVAAEAAINAGTSAIGFNFFEKSPRFVEPNEAARIVSTLPTETVLPVGLFVNHSLSDVETIAACVGLNAIQLHGDEPPAFVAELQQRHPDWMVLKAFRINDSLLPVAHFLTECDRLKVRISGCLLDARVEGAFGGTGVTAPWELIAREYDRTHWPPLILAGGLNAENVAAAIEQVRPAGVDTASGVELSPGVKDATLTARFLAEARRAFAQLSR